MGEVHKAERKYSCQYCYPTTFSTKAHRQTHIKNAHPGEFQGKKLQN